MDSVDEFMMRLNNFSKQVQMSAQYKCAREDRRRETENRICNLYAVENGSLHANIVSKDIAIVEHTYGCQSLGFYAVVNMKPSPRCWSTFEDALLCAISINRTGTDTAAMYMRKLLG